MATKQVGKEKEYDLEIEESETLKDLKAKRDALSGGVFKDAEALGNAFKKLDTKNIQQVKQGMSKLDAGMEQFTQFRGVVADIAAGLSDQLMNYTDYVRKTGSYEGIEKIVQIFSKQKAHSMRVGRLQHQDPEKNLQVVIDYGRALIREILEVRKEGIQTYEQLKVNTDIIVEKVKEFQPREEKLKEQKDAMEAEYATLDERLTTAKGAEQVELSVQKNELHEKLASLREQYDAVLTQYDQAQKAQAISEKSRDSFEMMNRNLAMQAVMIKEKLDNLTQVYLAAPKARNIMNKTKGMEITDQAMNVAADQCLEATIAAAEGVAQATTARAKMPTIDEKKMQVYIKRIADVFETYGIDSDEISKLARRSQGERYGKVGSAGQ